MPKPKKPTHGGRRKGAGRKPLGDSNMTLTTLYLTAEQIEKARRLGAGELARGVRRAIDEAG